MFDGVSLSLPAGSFHFVTGPSGAGKTTLLKLCYLEMAPEAGEVQLFGKETEGLGRDEVADMRRKIGVVHQDCRFVDHLSVSENVLLPATATGVDIRDVDDNMSQLLAWVGLSRHRDRRPPELSGGEKQRAALARAVILSPDLILADEPTGIVDWEMSLKILDLLVELNKSGKTVICATHDLSLIRQAKTRAPARVLRIRERGIELSGADL